MTESFYCLECASEKDPNYTDPESFKDHYYINTTIPWETYSLKWEYAKYPHDLFFKPDFCAYDINNNVAVFELPENWIGA